MCRSDADVFSLMTALPRDLGVIDLKFTSKSKFEFSLLKKKVRFIFPFQGRTIPTAWTKILVSLTKRKMTSDPFRYKRVQFSQLSEEILKQNTEVLPQYWLRQQTKHF